MTTPGRLTWTEPLDGLRGTLERFPPDRWSVTVSRPGRPGAAAAVRDTREEAVGCVADVLAAAREVRR